MYLWLVTWTAFFDNHIIVAAPTMEEAIDMCHLHEEEISVKRIGNTWLPAGIVVDSTVDADEYMDEKLRRVFCAAYNDPKPYMDGPNTLRTRDWNTFEEAVRAGNALASTQHRDNLHIESRYITEWKVVD